MSGNATFSGTNYQASVIAFVFVHVLTETKLRWLSVPDDTPSAVSGEVKGPGDDARVEFRSGVAPIEIQAKHGLKPQKCVEAFQAIRDGSTSDDRTVVMLAVDATSSPAIRNDLWRDLDRLRSGRSDGLKPLSRDVSDALGDQATRVTKRVRILNLNVDAPTDSEAARALALLTEYLEDPSQANAAWAVLEKDAARMSADKSRRTRKALVDLLAGAGMSLRPPLQSRKWHEDLRHSKKLLADDEPALVLSLLREIESDYRKSGVQDGTVLYRLFQHRASALLQLGRYNEALDSAQRALDQDPDGVHALVNLANAQALSGDVDAACETAARATTKNPQSPSAWLMRFQLSLNPGQPPVAAPPDVAATHEYRTDLVRVYLFHGEADQARDVSASLIEDGNRSASVLILRIQALLFDADSATATERLSRAQEVERLCNEVLEEEASIPARLTQRALTGRSVAGRIQGRVADAQEDSRRAHAIRPDDAHAVMEAAQAKIQAGDEDAALELLVGPVVEENPFLLAMRASLLGREQISRAKKDLDAVLQAIPGFHQPDRLRSAAAEAALHLNDLPLAKQLAAEMSPQDSSTDVHRIVMTARIAVLEGDLERAERDYRRAGTLDPAHRSDLLAELGTRLLQGKRPEDSVRVLREAQPLPSPADRIFVRALIETNQLVEAHATLERLAANGPMPDWAVAFAAQIALRRNDPKNGAAHLEALFARGVTTPDGRLMLVDALLDLEEHERAMFHARALIPEQELTPRERMALGQLLLRLGDATSAIEVGLRALRDAPDDAQINRAFASTVFLSKSKPVEVDQVGGDTHVTLRNEEGNVLEYLVFADCAGHRLSKEIPFDEAQKAGLVGLRVGDVFVQDRGAWFEKKWRVEQIQSAVKYLANDIIANYGTRFPSEEFFAVGFRFNSQNPSITDFQPMITSTHEHDRHQQKLLDVYQEQCPPLAVIAQLAGTSTPALIAELSRTDGRRPVYVEWSDSAGQLGSRAAARLDTPTVLTRSALFTAQVLELLPLLMRSRRCIAPRSLRDEIRAELADATERVEQGWTVVAASERGLAMESLKAGDSILVRRRDSIRSLLEWADDNVTFLPRPLETFGDSRMHGGEMRSQLGESSNDALELSLFTPGVLYADDLGLRRLSNGLGVGSFSSIALIQVLAEVGLVAPDERDRLLVDSVGRHYCFLEVSPELLMEALAPGRAVQTIRDVFSMLAAPPMDIDSASRVVVRAVRLLVSQTVKTTTSAQIARHALEMMSTHFEALAVAAAVNRAADAELSLLPRELGAVKAACAAFRKARTVRR